MIDNGIKNMTSRPLKIVRQLNRFIEAPYSIEFSVHELKIIEYLVSERKRLDNKLIKKSYSKEFYFSPTQLAKILNTSVSRIVSDGDKLSKKRHIDKLEIFKLKMYDVN